jgi:hypothetical protein
MEKDGMFRLLWVLIFVSCASTRKLSVLLETDLKTLETHYTGSLPSPLKSMIQSKNFPSYSALVACKEQSCQLICLTQHCFRLRDRLDALETTITQLRASNGTYLLDIGDSIDTPYPWPILTFASKKSLVKEGHTVLWPDFEAQKGYGDQFNRIATQAAQMPWDQKSALVFWRGGTTGAFYNQKSDWPHSPRVRFLDRARGLDFIDAGFVGYVQFSNPTLQKEFAKEYPLVPPLSPEKSIKYKYLIDVDGNSCTYSRMAWILRSNSLLWKHASDNIQWYYDRLIPFRPGAELPAETANMILIEEDFSNLKTAFDWSEAHPKEVQTMIQNAQNTADQVFSREGIKQAVEDAFKKYKSIVDKK